HQRGTDHEANGGSRASHPGCPDTSCILPTRARLSETSDRSAELSLPEIAGQGSVRGCAVARRPGGERAGWSLASSRRDSFSQGKTSGRTSVRRFPKKDKIS